MRAIGLDKLTFVEAVNRESFETGKEMVDKRIEILEKY